MTASVASDACGVTIIIAAFNSADTLARAVNSALAQSDVAEVVVVDDASGDETCTRALACEDGTRRLRLLRQTKNAGPSAARNRAIADSTSPWIGILDADDFLLPGRIGALLRYRGDGDLICDNLLRTTDPDQPGISVGWTASDQPPRQLSFRTFVEGNLGKPNQKTLEFGFAKPLVRRSMLEAFGLTYNEGMRLGEDYNLYARAIAKGARFLLTPEAGYVSVARATSLSVNHPIADLEALLGSDDDIGVVRDFDHGEQRALDAHRISIQKRIQWRKLIDAYRRRSINHAVASFTSPAISAHLIGQLTSEALVRSQTALQFRSLRRAWSSIAPSGDRSPLNQSK